MNLELNGKIALVTAASAGIGGAVATTLAREGATVATSSRDPSALINGADVAPGRLVGYPADLGNPQDYGTLVERVVNEHGRLDIMVVNTPGPRIIPVLDVQDEDWAEAYDLLARPAIKLAHDAAKQMAKQRGGSLIFITSTWVKQSMHGGVLSATMRSTLSALAKQMALELGPLGVRVNQVMPGATGTARMESILSSKAQRNNTNREIELAKVVETIPLGRWAEVQEIADTVAFVASPRCNFMTGATLQIDGGAIRSTL
ncbi:oxidoreductase [Burkholderia sp. MSh2]|uniref:Short chain dehydrogenase n=1 Tax=Burkholderia paludis TaxID=1506587 RepID=A0A6J5F1J1_9BURK|nr:MULTISPECIES: SDR family oxidoreductase [Burkholderia]KEZ01311.1 oxidoreductase [Burkholderia sp. MSh2]CAB3772668.1 3-oxoacyl-[acyl-carrier-protein] reductase FabG [Burkholderia paludis]VWB63863.1 short chain dehydrogenase [Burkholderia paludis]